MLIVLLIVLLRSKIRLFENFPTKIFVRCKINASIARIIDERVRLNFEKIYVECMHLIYH